VNRGSTDGKASDQGDGAAGMVAPTARSGATDGSVGPGAMSAPASGDAQRAGADNLWSRTDRGNQSDEDVGSSAARTGERKASDTEGLGDPDPLADAIDRLGPPGSSENPDVTGTKDELEDQ
jgi:hypothetical protein